MNTSPKQLPGYDGPDGRENPAALMRRNEAPLAAPLPYIFTEPAAEPDDFQTLLRYARILWRHKWTLAFSLLLGIIAALGVSLTITPMYRSAASIEIQGVRETFGSLGGNDASLGTQMDVLKSKTLREAVYEKLVNKPAPKTPEVQDPLAWLRNLLGLAEPVKSVAWDQSVAMAAGTLRAQAGRESNVLTIQADSPNPLAAADFANMLIEEYMASNQQQRWESYQKEGAWLTRAQQETKADLEKAERRLADFARTSGLTFTGENNNVAEGRLEQLHGALAEATAKRIEIQAKYQASQSDTDRESLPEVLDSGPMASYQVELAKLRQEKAQLATTLTPNNNRIRAIQNQIDELEKQRNAERSNIIGRIKIEYDAAIQREKQLQNDFNAQARSLHSQSELLIQHDILKREAEGLRRLYETTLQKGREASIAAASRASNARVVDPAEPAYVPHWPNLPLNLALGSMGSLFLGAAFVIVRTRTDVSVQGPGALTPYLHLRELGVIPAAKTDPSVRALVRKPSLALRGAPSSGDGDSESLVKTNGDKVKPGECLELVTWVRKPSILAEAFRSVMTSILFSGHNGDRPRVLLVTSPSPQEGKSTVSSNLAIALAEVNQRVLLIDADMRLPRMHDIFKVPNSFGLSDLLNERTPVAQYDKESFGRPTAVPNLHVLPAGPAHASYARLLYSPRLQQLMDRFRDEYDIVLVDSAPVLTVPDARMLARATDAVVLVLRARKTSQGSALAAARCFAEDGVRVLGTILNDWNPNVSGYGNYDSYAGYSSGYYSQYYVQGR